MSESVALWLERLGLSRYAEAFENNAIGLEHLTELDHDILKEIGVVAAGHRMTILKAAADPDTRIDAEEAARIVPPSSPEPERRQLTVMFCDLVGSTELSQKLDPEDLRDINRTFQDVCKSSVERYEGYVARYMGDGVLVYFGFPMAHEDDAERAVHAALRVVEKVTGINRNNGTARGVDLSVRIGIATGVVVVGDLIGEHASQESAVVGETPNLAARLQTLAPRNAAVIASRTRELVAGRFELEDMQEHHLKGFATPVHAWRVVAPTIAESRFDALHGGGATPLVGREHEIGLLVERWEQAKEGDGQVVLLSGEAGIGKSRVLDTLQQRTAEDEPMRLSYQCSPFHTNSALHPVIEQIERAAQLAATDSRDEKLAKLESLLAQSMREYASVAQLFAPLLSIQSEGRYAALDMTPERQKAATLDSLVAYVEDLARSHPVLLAFEDAHWADPTSLTLLELIIERVQTIPVLAIITSRPEFSPPWVSHTHVTSLTLNRFTRNLVTALVAKLTEGAGLPEELLRHIVEKTDGIPLFVEELTKTVLESGLSDEESGSTPQPGGRSTTAIPATLHDSLIARLDRLSTGKQVAQAGAVIGREFPQGLLETVCGLPPEKLGEALRELSDAGLIFRQTSSPASCYIFKHALVQEAAYESLLHSKRRRLHERIAEGLLSEYPQTADTQPELLAYHYTEAGDAESAIDCWLQAGKKAAARAANQEAISHLTAGLGMLPVLPESAARARRELELQLELCGPYLSTKGWGAAETAKTFLRARELCTSLGETEQLPPVLYGEYMRELSNGRFRGAREVATELLRFGEQQRDSEAILQGHRILGWVALYLGEFSVSRDHADTVLRLHDPVEHSGLKLRYGHDTRVAGLCVCAILQSICGYPDQARSTTTEALDYAGSIDHEPTMAYALMSAGALPAALRADPEEAAQFAEKILLVAENLGSQVWSGYGRVMSGWSAVVLACSDEGAELFRQGIETLESTAPHPWQTIFIALLAEIHNRNGETDRAIRTLESALELIEQTNERMWEAAIHNLFGETLLAQGTRNAERAETSFLKSISVARNQGAKLLELRAATGLARLWQSQGKSREARDLLAPLYDGFTEGFTTADLRNANTLLTELV